MQVQQKVIRYADLFKEDSNIVQSEKPAEAFEMFG